MPVIWSHGAEIGYCKNLFFFGRYVKQNKMVFYAVPGAIFQATDSNQTRGYSTLLNHCPLLAYG